MDDPVCTQCGACMAQCPRHIPVPEIIAAVDEYKNNENYITAQKMYDSATTFENCASRCVECGSCQGHCIPRVKIFKYLKDAKEIFGR